MTNDGKPWSRWLPALLVALVVGLGTPMVAMSETDGGSISATKPCNSSTEPALGRPRCPTTTAPPPTTTTATATATSTVTTTTTVMSTTTLVTTTPLPSGSKRDQPMPIAGKTVVVRVLRGAVYVRRRGARTFVRVGGTTVVPVGSMLDTARGRVSVQSANGSGDQTGAFTGGRFTVGQEPKLTTGQARQARAGHASRARRLVTVVRLTGGSFAGCDADDLPALAHASSSAVGHVASARPRRHRRVRRKLWSSDSGGAWTSVGGDAAATVRGTVWLTEDLCTGTYIYVKQGAVIVTDLVTRKHIRLSAHHSYLATAPDTI